MGLDGGPQDPAKQLVSRPCGAAGAGPLMAWDGAALQMDMSCMPPTGYDAHTHLALCLAPCARLAQLEQQQQQQGSAGALKSQLYLQPKSAVGAHAPKAAKKYAAAHAAAAVAAGPVGRRRQGGARLCVC